MPSAFLLDLEGTLYTDQGAAPGGPEALAELTRRGGRFRCVSNTTTRARSALAARLAGYGYDIPLGDIITPVSAALSHCRARGIARVAALVREAALEDLAGLEILPRRSPGGEPRPGAVLVGDLGSDWTFELMQEAFEHLVAGAELIALSRDRYFMSRGRLTLDAGPFVAGLEYATGRTATVIGKPSPEFFHAACKSLGVPPEEVVMVGDDLWSDIQGAQRAGLSAWLVRTGKFREEALRESGIRPERIVESVAEVRCEE